MISLTWYVFTLSRDAICYKDILKMIMALPMMKVELMKEVSWLKGQISNLGLG